MVRKGEEQEDEASTDLTQIEQSMAMPSIAEESETEYPSFTTKHQPYGRVKRADSEFDKVIDSVLEDNRSKSPMRRDDFSDDDDDDLSPAPGGGNPLKDFTFVGGRGGLDIAPKKKT